MLLGGTRNKENIEDEDVNQYIEQTFLIIIVKWHK